MAGILRLLIILPIAGVLVTLAVINRGPVTLLYVPPQFGGASVTMPAFLALFVALMVGVVIGGVASWWAQGSHRRLERVYRREAEKLKAEAERLKAMQPASAELSLPALKR
jgi:uncharacterized integral membrane protein